MIADVAALQGVVGGDAVFEFTGDAVVAAFDEILMAKAAVIAAIGAAVSMFHGTSDTVR